MKKRILLKISGEAFLDSQEFGVNAKAANELASMVAALQRNPDVTLGIVLGGGNIFRGLQGGAALQLERTRADQIGMLATVMNGILLENLLQKQGCPATVISAIPIPGVAASYDQKMVLDLLENKNVTIFVGGTGQPYFTTDTAAALRACQIGANLFMKATTRVDGVYNKDPLKHADATRYAQVTYEKVLQERLGILDLTAIALCMTNNIPIRVFNLKKHSFVEALNDESFGSIVKGSL